MAVGVHALLHESRVAEHEMEEGDGSHVGVGGAAPTQRTLEGEAGDGRPQPERIRAEHQFSPIAVGEQGVPEPPRRAEHIRVVVGDRGGDAVGELGEELLFAREVPVERARLHIESGRDPPHGQVSESDLVQQGEGGAGYSFAVVTRRVVLRGHAITIVNTVQVNGVQEGVQMTARRDDLGRELARTAIFAALIVVLGTVTIPIPGGVPITAQTLGVMLAGAVLGPRLAPLSVLLVLALAAIGLPVLAGGRGGVGVFVGPTAGYLVGWVAGALIIALIVRSGRPTAWSIALAAVVGGIVVVYIVGIPVQALVLGLDLAPTAVSSLVFLPGDLVKAAAATVLTLALRRAYPRAFADSAAPAGVRAA